MDLLSFLPILLMLFAFGFTIYVANQQQALAQMNPLLPRLLYGLLAVTAAFGVIVLQFSAAGPLTPAGEGTASLEVPLTAAIANVVVTTTAVLLSVIIMRVPGARLRLKALLGTTRYDPDSAVHMTAVVLCLVVLALNTSQFVLGGGLDGLADAYSDTSISLGDLLFNQLLWVIVALLGVGWMIRRSTRVTLERLGVRAPSAPEVVTGVLAGLGLFMVIIGFGALWALLLTPEQMEAQTQASAALAASITTLPVALFLSVIVGISEELFFRGALQPVFGVWLTSAFFTLLHSQYTLTPATLGIFVVSAGLGWLARWRGTVAAMIAHFVYNFVQLALAILASGIVTS